MADGFLRPGQKFLVCSAQAVVTSLTWTSDPIDLSMLKLNQIGLQYELEDAAGNGQCKIEALLSANGVDYVDTLADIVAALTKANGSQLDKIAMDSIPALSMKILVTEEGGVEDITISIWAAGK